MAIKKEERLRITFSGTTYEVVGKWGRDIVLAPIDGDEEQCLVYEPGELENILEYWRLMDEGGKK